MGGGGIMTPPLEPSSPVDGGIRKRVCKACDRCRLKKSKCDGSSPCSRCKADNAICVFGERKKSHDKVYPKGYVEMLENQQSQLVTGLQELYRRLQHGEGWNGTPLKENGRGTPLTHDILERLGALKQEGNGSAESFEENLEVLQQRLIAGGAGFMQREHSSDANSDVAQSPSFEHVTHQKVPAFTNPFSSNHFPPTPPSGSPHPQYHKASSPLKTQAPFSAPHVQSNLAWHQDMSQFSEAMEFDMTFDSPISDPSMNMMAYAHAMYPDQTALGINPCLTMKEWPNMDDQMARYFNPNVLT